MRGPAAQAARLDMVRVSTRDIALAALAVFVFSIPYENGIRIAGIGTLARLIGYGAIGVVLLASLGHARIRLRVPSLFLLAAALYVLWGLATYLWSINPSATMTRGATLVQLAAMAWMVHQVGWTQRHRDVLAQAFVLGTYASISVALIAFFTASQTGYRDVGGLNPNYFAIGCAFAVPVAWSLAVRAQRPLLFWLNALYPAFAILAVVLSASRGGFITLLVALTVIPLSLSRMGPLRQAMVFAFVAAVAGASFVAAPQVFANLERNLERLGGTVEEIEEGTLTGRTGIWEAGFEVFRESPIIGHGYATFGVATSALTGRIRAAHNAFLSVAVGAGLIGLGMFVSLLLIATVGVMRNPDRRVEYLVLLATLVVGMSPANLEHNKSVWFILSWLAAGRPLMLVPPAWAQQLRQRLDSQRARGADRLG